MVPAAVSRLLFASPGVARGRRGGYGPWMENLWSILVSMPRTNCLATHAVARTRDGHMQAGGLGCPQQLSELLGHLRVSGDIPDFRNLRLVYSAIVIGISGGQLFDDVSVPVGGSNDMNDWPEECEQDEDSSAE
jgi:hypothetical protein